MSTLSVVEQILKEAAVPMSVREIVERAGATLPTKSKTPDTVVARDLSMDIKKKGEGSMFIRTSPGRYAMREQFGPAATADTADTGNTGNTGNTADAGNNQATPLTEAVSERAPTKAATHPSDRLGDQTDSASA